MTINFSWNFPFRSWNFFELHPPNVNPLATPLVLGPGLLERLSHPVGEPEWTAFLHEVLLNF